MDYQTYMHSEAWRRKRLERLAIDRYCCQCCGCFGTELNKLEVHHLNYRKAFGAEDPYTDLVTLCHACHRGIHRIMNRVTRADGRRGWKDALPRQISVAYGDVIEL